MRTDGEKKRFLEPVYMNCASYLFEGVIDSSEVTDKTGSARAASLKFHIPFVSSFLGAPAANASLGSQRERVTRTERAYHTGAVHMQVVDELFEKDMIKEVTTEQLVCFQSDKESFVATKVLLRPNDYFSFLRTLGITTPLLAQGIKEFDLADKLAQNFKKPNSGIEGRPVAVSNQSGKSAGSRGSRSAQVVESLATTFSSVIKHLEEDYLISKQLQMIMWSNDEIPRAIGVVDLDFSNENPYELRSKLSGGQFYVIGKVVNRVGAGASIDLLEKTILFNAIDLIRRVSLAQNNPQAVERFQTMASEIRYIAQQFLQFQLQGPAVRLAAMSVCL